MRPCPRKPQQRRQRLPRASAESCSEVCSHDARHLGRLISHLLTEAPLVLVVILGCALFAAPTSAQTVSLVLQSPNHVGSQLTIPEDGGIMNVTATMDQATDTEVTVTISVVPAGQTLEPVDPEDYDVSGTELTLAPHSTTSTGTVTVHAVGNNWDDRRRRPRCATTTTTATATAATTEPPAVGRDGSSSSRRSAAAGRPRSE